MIIIRLHNDWKQKNEIAFFNINFYLYPEEMFYINFALLGFGIIIEIKRYK